MVPSDKVKSHALELGFDLVGVCPAESPQHLDFYQGWLDRGFHGEMSYMAKQLNLREHPRHLLEGVQSIVAVGLNYYQETDVRPGYPRIARYALGRDYHKILRSKLRKLGDALAEGASSGQLIAFVSIPRRFSTENMRSKLGSVGLGRTRASSTPEREAGS